MTKRDGATLSLWQNSVNRFVPTKGNTQNKFDVIIAGAGITGLSLGLQLQKAGRQCLIIEACSIGYGTTGGTTAHLNTMLDTSYKTIIKNFGLDSAKLIAGAAQGAIASVKKNIEDHHIECGFKEEPGFLFAQNTEQEKELEDILASIQAVGLAADYCDSIPIPVDFTKAFRIEGQAKFHPLRYVYGLAEAFEKAGGVIVEDCRVKNVTPRKEQRSVSVESEAGNLLTNFFIHATHIPIGVNLLHMRCPAYRSYAIAVKLGNGSYPDGLAYDMYDPYHYYRTQEIDGEKFLIVGGADHKTGEKKNTRGSFLKLESHTRASFDVAEIVHRWSSQYFEPVDGLPYIGQLPGNPESVLAATGFSGNGITYSQIATKVLTSIVLNERNKLIDVFAPSRVKPIAGFTEFVKHNSDVAKHFIAWFGLDKIESLAGLAPGEARILKYEGHSLALYKDDESVLHAVNPACSHMKCAVNWNASEKSWDCPCHGSRFSYTGEVLTGPATQRLEQIELKKLLAEENVKGRS